MGARGYHCEWPDSFAAGRNESLKNVRGRWIFWMDSDDTIPLECGRKLRRIAETRHDSSTLGFVMQVHCPGVGEASDEITVVDHVKMFRTRHDLRFEHRIHKQIQLAIDRAGGRVAFTAVYVVHSGYDHSPQGQQHKLDCDLRLLQLELNDPPNHPFSLFNLRMKYTDVKEYSRALTFPDNCVARSGDRDSHVRKTYVYQADCYQGPGDIGSACRACEAGLLRFLEDADLQFRLAIVFHGQGEPESAASLYHGLLTHREAPYFKSSAQGNNVHLSRHDLALIYEKLQRGDGAEKQWRAIVTEQPRYRAAWRAIGDNLIRQRLLIEAALLMEEMRRMPPLVNEAFLLQGKIALAKGSVETARRCWLQLVEEAQCDRSILAVPFLGVKCWEITGLRFPSHWPA